MASLVKSDDLITKLFAIERVIDYGDMKALKKLIIEAQECALGIEIERIQAIKPYQENLDTRHSQGIPASRLSSC